MSTFYLTTPLYYPNARPHVGSAYTTIVCDVLARYKRMCGYDVAFLTGTDEHGEKLARAAAASGKSPGEFVAEQRKLFVGLWRKLGLEYDYFVYTDQPDHVTSVQRMLLLAQKNEPGVVEKRRYEGRYCIDDERYVSDSTDPVNCDICGRPAELISEDNYFFRLSAFEERLLKLYRRHLDDPARYPVPFVQPDFRLNEVSSLVKSGLRDISISRRRIKWGVPWPGDPEQVFYVWYDALIGYMTGIGYAQGERGNATFQKYWRNTPGGPGVAPDGSPGEFMHMIGKDILRQHAVYWPAFLMAAGLPLPKTVFAHGYINYEQDKMSKSKGNVAYPEPIVDAFDSFSAPGNDALRYYLLREAPFGQDMSFSYHALIQRYNSDLANGLGNLASRILTMVSRNCAGEIPSDHTHPSATPAPPQGFDRATLSQIVLQYEEFRFSVALESIGSLIASVDKFLVQEKPWSLLTPAAGPGLERVLYLSSEALRVITILAHPVLPRATEKIWKQLGCEGKIEDQRLDQLQWGGLQPGTKVGKPEPIFPRLDKYAALEKLLKLEASARGPAAPEPVKEGKVESQPQPNVPATAEAAVPQTAQVAAPVPTDQKISIDDFAKVEMRVGEIVSAEAIPGAKKLLKLMVDIGSEVRQVAAGIAEYYQPEQLVGTKVVLVVNLQPRKLRGVESNGMIVAASVGDEGKPVLVTFGEDVPKGARLK